MSFEQGLAPCAAFFGQTHSASFAAALSSDAGGSGLTLRTVGA
jgi:hypothetical protein